MEIFGVFTVRDCNQDLRVHFLQVVKEVAGVEQVVASIVRVHNLWDYILHPEISLAEARYENGNSITKGDFEVLVVALLGKDWGIELIRRLIPANK